ncbi:hypothetical protein IC229_26285 [Spirosoma sp. BT702]|uniref:Uncharacterized protein n=1 Tax=Spirosoma profusum TaxID=2771354 RepID=A0A926Y544_9BACT|nr:hypothetical protein [Spirosoma profusum]MBD2704180.1 hypothetical protein [Spirosoma profusum]
MVDLSEEDEEAETPERITDPIIKRYGHKLHLLAVELQQETEHYELNREQIDALTNALFTIRDLLVLVEDLETLDAILRMTFAGLYYAKNEELTSDLTRYPLTTSN